ncbi:MAG: FG-GAP-like repeat-containing protein, partial [Pyrinomonadaceae bacterium]
AVSTIDNVNGIFMSAALVHATGTGVVTLNGRGGGGGSQNLGIRIESGSLVRGGSTVGTITTDLNGTGNAGANSHGIQVDNSTVTSMGGHVRVRGFSGPGTGANNYGVIPIANGLITSGGNGNVTVEGTGGTNGAGGNVGVIPHQGLGRITSGGTGTVTVTGTGGAGGNSHGVQIFRTGTITSGGSGQVSINGTANASSFGFFLNGTDAPATVTSGGGPIVIDGTGGTGIATDNTASTIGTGGNLTISLIADTINIGSNPFINAGTGTVNIRQRTNGRPIELGGADSATLLGLTDAEIDRVTAGTLNIGNSSTGGILFSTAPINVTDAPVIPLLTLTTGGTGITSNPAIGVLDVIAGELRLNSSTTTSADMDATTLVSGSTGAQVLSEANTVTLGNGGINATVASPVTLVSGRFNTVAATGGVLASTVQVQSGATIGGTGNSNTGSGNTIQSGAFVSPGTSPGILTLNTLTFNAGSTLDIEIGGTAPGNTATNHDQLNVFSTVNLGGATLSLSAVSPFVPSIGDTFVIVNNDNSDPVVGTFAGLAEGATITGFLGSGLNAKISYVGGDGNDIVLTAVLPPADVVVSAASLADFGSVTVGNTSATQTYNVSGVNLTANLVVTAPANYEISLSPTSGFGGMISIAPSSGTVLSTPIYARFVPGTTGALGGDITNASTGATTENVAVTGTGGAATCVAPPANMIAWYSAEGNADDRFGVNNGTLTNGATATGAGKVGQAFSLDGTDDLVSTSLTIDYSAGATIDAWINPDGSGNGAIVSDGGGSTSSNGMGLFVDAGIIRVFGTNGSGINFLVDGPSVVPGSWSHLAVTWDGTTAAGGVKLYVNGVQAATGQAVSTVGAGTSPFGIGGDNVAAYEYNKFDGLIDEVEVFNRALTATEVANIYNASTAGKCVAPEIVIEEPVTNVLVDNVGSRDFGSSLVGTPGTTKTFTVRNAGTTTLNIDVVNILVGGGNATDFVVNTAGMSPTVYPNGNTAFTVQFTAGAAGPRATDLDIPSDDADENPFDIALVGNGIPVADLAITKTDGSLIAAQGSTVAYTLSYSNLGPSAASGVVLTETVPVGSTFNAGASTAGWVCAPNNNAGSICTLAIGAVAGGASGTATFAVTVSANATGTLSNTASVSSPVSDPNPVNNSATDVDNMAPTLGVYPPTTVALSDNIIITPNAAPIDTTSISVSAPTSFIGELTADPATGVVRVTNAALANIPPGVYPVTVRAFGPGGTTTTTFNLTVNNAPVCAGLNFIPASNFAAGTNPLSVAVGDFNGDGEQDLVTANFSSGDVSVLIGTGTGSFGAASNFTAGTSPYSVAVGDFNGDGAQDLAVANVNSHHVSILMGTGTGGFGMVSNFAVGISPRSVAVGDFNGDGVPDLAVANYDSSNVSVLTGTGTGSFGIASNFTAGLGAVSVAVGDFNGDGDQDLVVANYDSNNVSILTGTGTGSFGAASNFSVGTNPLSVAVGDFNGDGTQDLAVANFISNNVSILTGTGTGSFGAASNFNVGTSPYSVAVGDFSADGVQDIAIANYNSNNVSILAGTGTGNFGAASNFNVGTNPFSVAVGDFNGDGNQDIASANTGSNNISILRRTCNTPPTVSSNAISAPEGSPVGNFTIATAADGEQAPNTLGITVNGGASATVNGVTVSGLSIAAGGAVTANVVAACGATTATFTLVVTDAQGATGTGTLTVNITPNTSPTLTYTNPAAITYASGTVVNPATGPSDNGSVSTVAVQNTGTYTGGISVTPAGVVTFTNAAPFGTHTITIRATDNCGATTDATFQLTVNKAVLNVNAVAATKVYGDADPAFAATYSGFLLSDNAGNSGITGLPSCTRTAGETVAGSPYTITCAPGTLAAPNYTFATGTTANFTITARPVTVTADAKTKVFGAVDPPLTFTTTSLGTGVPIAGALSRVPGETVAGSPYAITQGTVNNANNPNYSITYVGANLTITPASTTTTVTALPVGSSIFGQSVTFTATVAVVLPGAGTPTGTVSFNIDGNIYCANTPINGSFQATCTQAGLPALPAGLRDVVAIYSGNANFNGSTGNLNYTVNKANTATTITNTVALATPTLVNQPYTVAWAVVPNPVQVNSGTPTGTVTVNGGAGGGSCSAPVAAGSCQVTPTTIGVKSVTATYNGDANFNPSTSTPVNHTVNVGISGTVRNGITNAPVAGEVMILGCVSPASIPTTTTNAAGQYSFAGQFVGPCSVFPNTFHSEPFQRNYATVLTNITNADFLVYANAAEFPRRLTHQTQYVVPGAAGTMPVILNSQDNEATLGYSITYDINPFAQPPTFVCGANAPGCTITNNTTVFGKVGVTITPAGGVFTRPDGTPLEGPEAAGPKEIARINFQTAVTTLLPSTDFVIGGTPTAVGAKDAANNDLLT